MKLGIVDLKKSGIVQDLKELKKGTRGRVISRPVLKKSNIVVNIPDYKAPSVLGDENRFFKGELNKEKRNFFLQ